MIGLVLTLALAAPPAEAARLFDAGEQAYQSGDFLLAARAYEAAYDLAPLPAVAFAVAQASRRQFLVDGDDRWLRKALPLYRLYLQKAPGGDMRENALLHVETLEKILASRPPRAEPTPEPPHDTQIAVFSRIVGARASVEGSPPHPVPFATSVAPGPHVVRVDAPGHAPAELTVLALEGRLVPAQLEPSPLPARLAVSLPPGADLFVDGKVSRPTEVLLAPGLHRLGAAEPGHVPALREVMATPGGLLHVDIRELEPTGQRRLARVALFSAAILAVLAGAAGGVALAEQGRAVDLDPTPGGATEARGQSYRQALEARDSWRAAAIAGGCGAATAGLVGALLYGLDPSRIPEAAWQGP